MSEEYSREEPAPVEQAEDDSLISDRGTGMPLGPLGLAVKRDGTEDFDGHEDDDDDGCVVHF